jgi:ABC-type oligopeptide transport system substrate-binding subunit
MMHLSKKAAVTADAQKRLDIFQYAEKILMEELPIMPIFTYTANRMNKKVSVTTTNNTGTISKRRLKI